MEEASHIVKACASAFPIMTAMRTGLDRWLAGEADDQALIDDVVANYRELVDCWKERQSV